MCLMIPYAQALDSDLYCQELDRMKEEIAQKLSALSNRTENVFHLDNARLDTWIVARQQLRQLACVVLMHSPYSPALTPNDC